MRNIEQGLADLVHENENGISVMQWLKIAYAHEWDNLMERLRPQLHGLDPRSGFVSVDVFLGGVRDCVLDLQGW